MTNTEEEALVLWSELEVGHPTMSDIELIEHHIAQIKREVWAATMTDVEAVSKSIIDAFKISLLHSGCSVNDGDINDLAVEIEAAIAKAKRESWNAALKKVAEEFEVQYWSNMEWSVGLSEVMAFLYSRHVHYPECHEQAKEVKP